MAMASALVSSALETLYPPRLFVASATGGEKLAAVAKPFPVKKRMAAINQPHNFCAAGLRAFAFNGGFCKRIVLQGTSSLSQSKMLRNKRKVIARYQRAIALERSRIVVRDASWTAHPPLAAASKLWAGVAVATDFAGDVSSLPREPQAIRLPLRLLISAIISG